MNLDPEMELNLSLKLYKDVKNVKQIREKVLKGELQCSIIKPKLIVDPFQVLIAANKASISEKLTTKTIYTEILFNLSPTKNISKSLQTFGIDDKDENILIAILNKEDIKEDADLIKNIDGVEISLNKLQEYTDLSLIKKIYKIGDKESSVSSILDSIVSRIATKDFVSF